MLKLSTRWLLILAGLVCGMAPGLAEPLRIGGSGSDLAAIRHLVQQYQQRTGIEFKVLPSIGSGGAVKALLMDDIVLGLASRELRPNEGGGRIVARKYAETPLVFAVSVEQPVDGLTREQLRAILSGELVEWNQGQPIRPIMRPQRESDTLALIAAMPEMEAALSQARLRHSVVAFSDQEAANMLEQVPGSIGTSTLSLIEAEQRPLKALRLDGVAATPENLAKGRYPLGKSLYFLTTRNPPAIVDELVEFILGDGRDYLQRTGHRLTD